MKDLLRQLIRADSTPNKGEAMAAEVLATYFNRHGSDRSQRPGMASLP